MRNVSAQAVTADRSGRSPVFSAQQPSASAIPDISAASGIASIPRVAALRRHRR